MDKKSLKLALILIIVVGIILGFLIKPNVTKKLTSPESLNKVISTPTPDPSVNVPKTYKFDKSTNLKEELSNVNPQILDSDFEGL